ncbi:MAG: nucleotide exchange factor GrpE [Gemmatimonadetes bacterium]|nr:nucleotide exchange factor GrpE [Gemmatimonadota bacterium]
MTKKHKKLHAHDEPAESAAPVAAVEPAPVVDPSTELSAEIERLKDQYVRLAADFDNFRRRVQKERVEMWPKAQGELVEKVLDALDDLGRVTHLDPERTSAKDLAAGVELVERKMLKQFEAAGLVRVGLPEEKFDPAGHEAVSTVAATVPEQDHTVALVFQSGYRFGGALLRPARVQVRIWADDASASES